MTTSSSINRKSSTAGRVGLYDIERTIGSGNFAVVKLATHRVTKSQVAIKIIDKTRLNTSDLQKVYREVQINKSLQHPNIIRLFQVMETDRMLYLVTEYAPNGDVFDYIARRGRLPECEARVKFRQLLTAIEYCHRRGIVHRDLKAENLLLDSEMNIKVADFGFGNFFSPGKDLTTWCGSPPYAAPEVFEGRSYEGPQIDVWSLGVVLYTLVSAALPFNGASLQDVRKQVLTGNFIVPLYLSADCIKLLHGMLMVDPKSRYTVTQIRRHRWTTTKTIAEEIHSEQRKDDHKDFGGVRILGDWTGAVEGEVEKENIPSVTVGHDISKSHCALADRAELFDDVVKTGYNRHVLKLMQSLGIDALQTIQALNSNAYDHVTAIYQLLCARTFGIMAHRRQLSLPETTRLVPPVINTQVILLPRTGVEEQQQKSANNLQQLTDRINATVSSVTDPLCRHIKWKSLSIMTLSSWSMPSSARFSGIVGTDDQSKDQCHTNDARTVAVYNSSGILTQ